jgi:5-methylcytosine-specific restriction protein A
MAVTAGHGNPNWTREEVILALDLYFDCDGNLPSKNDSRVIALSELLRSFPFHTEAARQPSFRNSYGVAFKLHNMRQVATINGLANVSMTDREVWSLYGSEPVKVKELANLIRAGARAVQGVGEGEPEYEVFGEGRVVTEAHLRRERNPKLRWGACTAIFATGIHSNCPRRMPKLGLKCITSCRLQRVKSEPLV